MTGASEMKPRFGDFEVDLFGAMADRLRAAAEELRLAGKARQGAGATAQRLETYARAIEEDLRADVVWSDALTSPPRRAGI